MAPQAEVRARLSLVRMSDGRASARDDTVSAARFRSIEHAPVGLLGERVPGSLGSGSHSQNKPEPVNINSSNCFWHSNEKATSRSLGTRKIGAAFAQNPNYPHQGNANASNSPDIQKKPGSANIRRRSQH